MAKRKKTKILQVVPHVSEYNGVVTHARAIDHHVKGDVYSPSDEMFFLGFNNFVPEVKNHYDIVHFHDCYNDEIAAHGDKVMMTQHCTDKAKEYDWVPADIVCISKEVRNERKKGRIVGQPIIIKEYPLRPKGGGILILNWNIVNEMAASINGRLKLNDKHMMDIRPIMRKFAKVVAVGRGALEAGLMGKAVSIVGTEYGSGQLTAKNYDRLKTHNFSGRCEKKTDWDKLNEEIDKMVPDPKLRDKIIAENDSLKIVRELYGTDKF